MKTEERLIESPSRPRRRGVWVAAGAFALVVVVGVAAALIGGGDPQPISPVASTTTEATTTTTTAAPDTTTTTEAPATTTTTAEETLIAIVEDMVEVHNTGDFAAWQAFFGEQPSVFGNQRVEDEDWDFQRSFFAANEQWTLTGECLPRPNSKIECPAELRNDFMGPAGLAYVVPQLDITFDPDGKVIAIGASRWDIRGEPEDYFAAFDAWLAETHPDVHASFGDRVGDPVTGDNWGALPSAADMPTALQYVDEFLAQSEVYPLTD